MTNELVETSWEYLLESLGIENQDENSLLQMKRFYYCSFACSLSTMLHATKKLDSKQTKEVMEELLQQCQLYLTDKKVFDD